MCRGNNSINNAGLENAQISPRELDSHSRFCSLLKGFAHSPCVETLKDTGGPHTHSESEKITFAFCLCSENSIQPKHEKVRRGQTAH